MRKRRSGYASRRTAWMSSLVVKLLRPRPSGRRCSANGPTAWGAPDRDCWPLCSALWACRRLALQGSIWFTKHGVGIPDSARFQRRYDPDGYLADYLEPLGARGGYRSGFEFSRIGTRPDRTTGRGNYRKASRSGRKDDLYNLRCCRRHCGSETALIPDKAFKARY